MVQSDWGLGDREVEEICRLLNQQLGFGYGRQKKYLFFSRLNKRLRELNLRSYYDYLAVLKTDRGELTNFYDLLTTNVTSFFREANQFKILERDILPVLVKEHQKDHKLRFWSAGCSSGEEAYSIAIILLEALDKYWDVKVLATDISASKLQEGMAGIYDEERIQSIPRPLLKKYFQFVPGDPASFQIKPELRKCVVFRKINLYEEFDIPSHIRFDGIFCRNVFIYLSEDARAKIINGFFEYLLNGGYLFLGHSESINTYADARWISLRNCIYKKAL